MGSTWYWKQQERTNGRTGLNRAGCFSHGVPPVLLGRLPAGYNRTSFGMAKTLSGTSTAPAGKLFGSAPSCSTNTV